MLILDFRSKVIQARRGIWSFNVKKIKMFGAFTYVGAQISNGLIVFVIMWALISLIAIVLAWPLTWDLILYLLNEYLIVILTLCISPVFSIVLKKAVLAFIGKGPIKNRCTPLPAPDAQPLTPSP